MKKIPCLFVREFHDRSRFTLTEQVTPGCEWVLAGEGTATRKWEGMSAPASRFGDLYEAGQVVNGHRVCGHAWQSSWCGHRCGRAPGHEKEGGHWCGFCGNPESAWTQLGRDMREQPVDFVDIDGKPGPIGRR